MLYNNLKKCLRTTLEKATLKQRRNNMQLFKYILAYLALCIISFSEVCIIFYIASAIFKFRFDFDICFKAWMVLWLIKIMIEEYKKESKNGK